MTLLYLFYLSLSVVVIFANSTNQRSEVMSTIRCKQLFSHCFFFFPNFFFLTVLKSVKLFFLLFVSRLRPNKVVVTQGSGDFSTYSAGSDVSNSNEKKAVVLGQRAVCLTPLY